MDNEQLQRILKSFADSVEGGTEFVLTQAPEVIQQLILWKRVENSLSIIIFLSLFVWLCRLCKQNIAASGKTTHWTEDDWPRIMSFVTGGAAGFVFLMLCCSIPPALQVWLAPKVYILEYLRSLM